MNHLPPRARRRPSRRLACLAALAVGAASFGGGGGQTAATSPGATTSDVLRIVNAYSIANLDPAQPGTVWMWDFGAAESTLAVGEDGRLEPWLATSVERLDDLTWQVQLRDDVTFHNGRPMDAEAYAAAIERQIELSADAVGLAGATLAVDGPSTVTITTPAPNAHVPALLAERGAFVVYDVEAVEAAAGDADALTDAGFYTGPYAIVEWDPENLVLVRNVDYWGGSPPLGGVEATVVPDEQARVLAVQSGEADIALYPPIESETVLAGRDDAFFRASERALQSVMMPLNVQRPPFDETDVRRAWSHALDYDVLGTTVTRGIFDVAHGLYPREMSYAVENQRFDLAEANRLLDAAGWEVGADGIRERDGQQLDVVLVALAQAPETQTLAVAIQDQARQAGFAVEIVTAEDQNTSTEDPDGWDTSLQLSGTLSATGQPIEAFGRYFSSDGDRNRGGIDDRRLDAIVPRLFAADDDESDRLLREAQAIIVAEQAYVLVPAFKRFLAVVGPDYEGYVVSNVRRHVTMETAPDEAR